MKTKIGIERERSDTSTHLELIKNKFFDIAQCKELERSDTSTHLELIKNKFCDFAQCKERETSEILRGNILVTHAL
jgi:hypothetical protein